MDTGHDRRLRYDRPATEWVEALPIGNGRLGGMVFGRPESERVAINEETLWAGGHVDRTVEGAAEHLPEIRAALFDGEYERAQDLCNEHLLGDPPGIRPYQPFCDLLIEQECEGYCENYRRELDLRAGVARVEFESGGTTYTRESFVSAPDDALVVRLDADEPGAIDTAVSIEREREGRTGVDAPDQPLVRGTVIDMPNVADMDQGQGGWGLDFEGRAVVRAEGADPQPDVADHWGDRPDAVEVEGADAVTVVFAAATDYDGPEPPSAGPDATDPTAACRGTLESVADRSYAALRERHVTEHRDLFERVGIDLGEPVEATTDDRLAAVRTGASDPDLAALYFQYGRYLLMASSRPGTLPANLQGIWNEEYDPAWHSCYTLDVNLEMNYWHAEVANLRECAEPLVAFVDSMRESGRATAREHYDCPGFLAHVDTDLWRTTTQTVDAKWGYWPMAAAWLASNLWEHYAFSGDREDLEVIYPILKEAAEFLAAFLVEHPEEGWLVTAPSASPENQFRTDDGQAATVCAMPTMDLTLIRDLFGHVIEAADRLDRDPDLATRLEALLEELPPFQIGADGTLQEWLSDFEAVNPGHRHISHLVGLYPAAVLFEEDSEVIDAARTALEQRLEHGGGHTGWSCAWTIAVFARLGEGERAHEHVRKLLAESTYDSLLDAHPPFQIDGNFGGVAGIAEMLLGSHGGELRLLPALPGAWPDGEIEGLRARGGYEVSLSWSSGTLDAATIDADHGGPCRVRALAGRISEIRRGDDDGEAVDFERPAENVVSFEAAAGGTYRLVGE